MCYLRSAVFAYNTSVQESTGETPFYLLYGRDARLPSEWYTKRTRDDLEMSTSDYRDQLLTALNEARAIANVNLRGAQAKQKALYDRRATVCDFRVGDLVALSPPRAQWTTVRNSPDASARATVSWSDVGPTTFVIEPCPGTAAEGHASEVGSREPNDADSRSSVVMKT